MAEEGIESVPLAEFENVWSLIQYSESVQVAMIIMVVGIAIIMIGYRRFSFWVMSQRIHYKRPHVERFLRRAVLPFFALGLITSLNMYIHTSLDGGTEADIMARDTLIKITDTFNILIIGYTVAHLVPIILNKVEKSKLEAEDFEHWFESRGFEDDRKGFFHELYKWIPPAVPPEDMEEEEFANHLKTEGGMAYLERYRTKKGRPIGGYEKLKKDTFVEWKRSERAKYDNYYENCVSGNNESGRKLKPGARPSEIYPIDVWREEKRDNSYRPVLIGDRPPGYAEKKRKNAPLNVRRIMPWAILSITLLGVAAWWGIDLFVLATATGGFSIGLGLALQETMQSYFAYIVIRKDKIVKEGDHIQLDTGYNGMIHKITPRVTYVMHRRFQSMAVVPTRQLVNSQVINYTKESRLVRFAIDVGVSYQNDPREVISIMLRAGHRALKEVKDPDNTHLLRQKRCPYLDENKPSCGCDDDIHLDFRHPVVRLNRFGDSSMEFSLKMFSRDYDAQFRAATTIRVLVHEEFKKHGIVIPWPIITLYRGDMEKEVEDIQQLDGARRATMDEYGIGSIPPERE